MVWSLRALLRCGCLVGAMSILSLGHAASAILIWPINPVMESDESADAVWLENRGTHAVTMQVRVVAWNQANYQDDYTAQKEIVASPPFAQIEPGKRQLVRLVRQGPLPARPEDAYRLLIDEVPDAAPTRPQPQGMGVRFQMRYSLPFFVRGADVWTQPRRDKERDPATATRPTLNWRLSTVQGVPYLEVQNTGTVHARLSRVRWLSDGKELVINNGLLGYVLAGQRMRWKLPADVVPKAGMSLSAQLADNTPAVRIPAH